MLRQLVLPIFSIVLALELASTSVRAQEAQPAAFPAVSESISRGDALVSHQQFAEALAAYREADKNSNHTCGLCFLRVASTERLLGDFVAALEAAQRAIEIAGNDHWLAGQAHFLRGSIFASESSDLSSAALKQAENEFRAALSADPNKSVARFYLGEVLLLQGRDADGVAELNSFINGPFAEPGRIEQARRLITSPVLAREPAGPAFSVVTLEGRKITASALRGKVVLLDFWATWCPPCRESVPALVKLHQEFADRPFQIVGVSADRDEDDWKSFIRSNHMDWAESIDRDREMQALFEVDAFPTYIVLDRSGVIGFRQSGFGGPTAQNLERAINRALSKPFEAQPAAATAPPPAVVAPPVSPARPIAPAQLASIPLDALAAAAMNPDSGVGELSDSNFIFPSDDVENGDAEHGIYRNDLLRLRYKWPQSLSAVTPESLEQMNQAALEWMKKHAASNSSAPIPFPKIIFVASADRRNHAPFVRISVAMSGALDRDSALKRQKDLEERGATVSAPLQEIALGKLSLLRTDLEFPWASPPVWTASLQFMAAGQFRVTLEIFALSKSELDSLLPSAESLVAAKK
ncbi:MAG: redoxin family protein [Candidatus Acidiferrales bacterium]